MVTCEKLSATISEATCRARQQQIKSNSGPQWGHGGHYEGANKYISCVNCETGLKLLKEPAMEETNSKRCSRKTCLKVYPATAEYFGSSKQSKDGLNYYCRSCQAELVKAKYVKKTKIEAPVEVKPVEIKPVEEKTLVKTQVCSTCQIEKPLTKEFYHRHKGMATGFRGVCKECRADNRPDKVGGDRIMLNFDVDQALLTRIHEWSKKDRRTPDQQIMFMLENLVLNQETSMHQTGN